MADLDSSRSEHEWFRQAWADLVWGSRCVGCARPGPALCTGCAGALAPPGVIAHAVHPRAAAGGPYSGALRAAVLAHKEQGVREVGRPLAQLLAQTVEVLLPAGAEAAPVLLVPVPSRRSALRARGDDPWRRVVRGAAYALVGRGVSAAAAPVLRVAGTTLDQAGLDVEQRMLNLAGAMHVHGPALARLAHRHPQGWVVLCDDVLTTGATVREGCRALESAGLRVFAVAVLAHVEARRQGRDGRSAR